jgi:hypothetical protein
MKAFPITEHRQDFEALRLLLRIGGLILIVTGFAKVVSAMGNARILALPDPVLGIAFRNLFWIFGVIEVAIGVSCLASRRFLLSGSLVAWLSTNFVSYRIALKLVGYHKPCSCLGNLTDALGIPPQTADTAMTIALAYLFLTSYSVLWRYYTANKNEHLSTSLVGDTTRSV